MYRKWIILMIMLTIGVNVIQAHGDHKHGAEEAATRIGYYLKADANGVQQVYQQSFDGQSEVRQITQAASDVLTFGAAYDGLSVAYVSGGQLWLQPIHNDAAEAIASVSATQFFRSPVYSPDGQYIAYPDNGVWLLDLSTRETRQLLANVDVKADGSNMDEFRLYWPDRFVTDADGKATKLIVDVGVWEWNTVGVYDLASGDLQVLEGQTHTDLLPLSDGRVLVYGNTGLGGEAGLELADSLDNINSYTNIVNFGSVISATLFANQAVEVQPGVIRIFGQTIPGFPDEYKAFFMDYDLNTHVVGQVHMTHIQNPSGNPMEIGGLSPDGQVVPVYQDVQLTDAGTAYGSFSLVELGEDTITPLDGTVGLFRWQP